MMESDTMMMMDPEMWFRHEIDANDEDGEVTMPEWADMVNQSMKE